MSVLQASSAIFTGLIALADVAAVVQSHRAHAVLGEKILLAGLALLHTASAFQYTFAYTWHASVAEVPADAFFALAGLPPVLALQSLALVALAGGRLARQHPAMLVLLLGCLFAGFFVLLGLVYVTSGGRIADALMLVFFLQLVFSIGGMAFGIVFRLRFA